MDGEGGCGGRRGELDLYMGDVVRPIHCACDRRGSQNQTGVLSTLRILGAVPSWDGKCRRRPYLVDQIVNTSPLHVTAFRVSHRQGPLQYTLSA